MTLLRETSSYIRSVSHYTIPFFQNMQVDTTIKDQFYSQVWQHVPLIPALRNQRQADIWVQGQHSLHIKFRPLRTFSETFFQNNTYKQKEHCHSLIIFKQESKQSLGNASSLFRSKVMHSKLLGHQICFHSDCYMLRQFTELQVWFLSHLDFLRLGERSSKVRS